MTNNAKSPKSISAIIDHLEQLRHMTEFMAVAMEYITSNDACSQLTVNENAGMTIIMSHITKGMMECENLLSDLEARHA